MILIGMVFLNLDYALAFDFDQADISKPFVALLLAALNLLQNLGLM